MLIGIDLGTTFSAVAALNGEGKAEVIINRDGERTTPSVVMFEDGAVIVGEQAKENSVVDVYNVCQYVKRQMGNSAFTFEVSPTQRYSPEEISAMILKRLKEDAEDAKGEAVDGVVITVPAYFAESQKKATMDAGEIAGMKVLALINEPTAAAIAYCHGQANTDGNVMVFDLGGGTFDITIMKLSDNLKRVDILSTTGNRNLGGFDFDNVIISKVTEEFDRVHGIDIEDDDTAVQDLRIKAENAKKALSSRPKANISLVSEGKALKVEITREEFVTLIKGHLDSMRASMEIAMDEAGLQWSDLSKVLLVGGSTRIPAVQEMIQDVTGIEPSRELNPDEAVALGAAYYAETLHLQDTGDTSRIDKVIEVTDVNSHSLGIISTDSDTGQEMAAFILEKNSPLPASADREFCTTADGQSQVFLRVVEGEDEDPDYDTIIGTATIPITPRPAGSPLQISMMYDKDGIIHVRLKDLVDGRDLGEMQIEREANLSEEEVWNKRMLLDDMEIE